MNLKIDERKTPTKKRKNRIVDMPSHPWNTSFFMSSNENEVRFKTNPWEIRRIWVATFLLLMSVLLISAGIEGGARFWHNPEAVDYLRVFLGIPLAVYFFGVGFYLIFHRVNVALNMNELEYRCSLLLYHHSRRIPLEDILRFEYELEKHDSRHASHYVKAIIQNDELRMTCSKSDDAGWMVVELNYMRNYLLAKENGSFMPPFRKSGVVYNIEYRFNRE